MVFAVLGLVPCFPLKIKSSRDKFNGRAARPIMAAEYKRVRVIPDLARGQSAFGHRPLSALQQAVLIILTELADTKFTTKGLAIFICDRVKTGLADVGLDRFIGVPAITL